jgi:hypothetical protein
VEGFVMWCWESLEAIVGTNLVKNSGVLQKVNGIVLFYRKRKNKCNSIGQNLHGIGLLKRIIEGKMEEYK